MKKILILALVFWSFQGNAQIRTKEQRDKMNEKAPGIAQFWTGVWHAWQTSTWWW